MGARYTIHVTFLAAVLDRRVFDSFAVFFNAAFNLVFLPSIVFSATLISAHADRSFPRSDCTNVGCELACPIAASIDSIGSPRFSEWFLCDVP